jgi:hypothetical protein
MYQENLNTERINQIIKPLVISGIYKNNESALNDIIIDFVKNKIDSYKIIIDKLEGKYKVGFKEFSDRIKGAASIEEEDDWMDWKAAVEMKKAWVETLREMLHNEDKH